MTSRRGRTLIPFAVVCALAPLVARPVTVVDVSAAWGGNVQVHGWTQVGEDAPRLALGPRSAPFQLVLKGSDVGARFVVGPDDEEIRVRAVQRRAWIPLVRVGSVGSSVSLEGRPSFMGIRTP